MPNFKKLAKTYEKNATVALQQLVRINSVYDASSIKEGAPFGEGVKNALDYVSKLGQDYGFKVDSCKGYCSELTIGDEGPIIGVYAHSDVVPVTGKWTDTPFSGILKDGRIYGRGSCDDKGPLIASLYAIKLLKDNGLIKGYRVRLVAGGDEERGSSCLAAYFGKLHKEECTYGFTPDADWPLIYGEKAIRRYELSYSGKLGNIINMDGGVVANAVCDKLIVTLPLDKKLEEFVKNNKIDCDIDSTSDISIISFRGKAAHGSTPELGINAALVAFKVLGEFYHIDELNKITKALASPDGSSFGGNNHSPELLDSTFNYGIVHYDGQNLSISLDYRFGETANPDEAIAKLSAASGLKATLVSDCKNLLFDKKSPLVSTLMKVYKHETHQFFAKPFTIGGGTYAKEAKNTVAFGATWKGHPGNMHSPDEYIYLDDFYKDIAIYAHAIYALGKLSK
jgi:succinyl-diaminopimelate desuccinylase